MVHKATFTKRAGIEVFCRGKQMLNDRKKAQQIVAVKVLQGKLLSFAFERARNHKHFQAALVTFSGTTKMVRCKIEQH